MNRGFRIGLVDVPEQPATAGLSRIGNNSDYIPMTVESFDNHIYFYAEVNTDRCLDLIKKIREADNSLRTQKESRMLPKEYLNTPIWLHIQSPGGDLFSGLNMADQFKTIASPIYSIVEGYCASAATLISMSCNRKFITPNSFMLIHQLWSIAWGKYEELKDDMHLSDMLMESLRDFYSEKTKWNKKQVVELLKRDSWFNSKECIEHGLVDQFLEV